MNKMKRLEQEIEDIRHELVHLAIKKGFTNYEVIFLNQKLNHRINEYQQLVWTMSEDHTD